MLEIVTCTLVLLPEWFLQALAMLNPKKSRPSLKSYARYSNIALQMGAIIFAGTFGGLKLDEFLGWKFPLFTLLLSLSSVAVAIYLVIKDLLRKQPPSK